MKRDAKGQKQLEARHREPCTFKNAPGETWYEFWARIWREAGEECAAGDGPFEGLIRWRPDA